MRAIVLRAHGGPERLELGEIETPSLGACDVLIRMRAAGVNHIDHDMREGISRLSPSLPHILGTEGAGEIVAAGDAVTQARVGERVVPYNYFCGRCRHCLEGQENICPNRLQLGMHRWGTYADYVVVHEREVIRIPDSLNYVAAAASAVCFGTAWNMAVSLGRVTADETVLVNAAGSGIGSAAIQILKLHGARVIATAGSDAKIRQSLDLGADFGINYAAQDMRSELKRITGGAGVDLVIESVGGEILLKSIDALRPGGRLVTCGAHAGEEVTLNVIDLFRRQIALLGNHYAPRRHIATILEMVAAGKLRPVIHSVAPLDAVREASIAARDRNLFGKLVLTH